MVSNCDDNFLVITNRKCLKETLPNKTSLDKTSLKKTFRKRHFSNHKQEVP